MAYSKSAVSREIAKDNRIKGREARLIHAVRRGRQVADEPNIAKGTLVCVRTTNGGKTTARLLQTYRPTYCIVLELHGQPVVIDANRLKSVDVV